MDETYGGPLGSNVLAYGGEQTKMVSMPTMKQRIAMAVQEAERKLADAKRAEELFNKNPDLEELINIMQRGRF